jgi:N-acetylglucosamine-6-phosphate deacetylase
MRAAGTNLTESYLGKICPENGVIIDDGVAKLPDKSFFAGSIGTMDRALRFAVKNASINVEDAIKLVSLTPAKLMRIDDKKGSLENGKDADVVIADNDFNVKTVLVNGKVVVSNA